MFFIIDFNCTIYKQRSVTCKKVLWSGCFLGRLPSGRLRYQNMATKFTNWNTKGLNHPVMHSKVFSHSSKLQTDIAFLTETHLLNKDHSRLKRGGFSQIFHSKFNTKCRGVAIPIHREVQYVQTNTIQDKDGRFLIVFNLPVVLACISAPNWDNDTFFTDFFSLLPELNSHWSSGRFKLCSRTHYGPF